ncbi:MAG TPA: VOC family protein [Candidatus Polarisedimenticolaceae bacterium]|nr:VOC family protein [Candidatus Polarisedimenticolaceae bacterium]
MATKPIPEGFNTVSSYLVVSDAAKAIEFYAKAFGAERVNHMPMPGGKGTMHAEMRLGDSRFMLTDENPQWGTRSPKSLGGTPVSMHIYTRDADAMFKRAVGAGCEVQMPPTDMFWGDRYAKVADPFGHVWGIATHVEDVPDAELGKRAKKWFADMAGQ